MQLPMQMGTTAVRLLLSNSCNCRPKRKLSLQHTMTPGLEVERPVKRPRHNIAKRTRMVRFILMERLSGECTDDIGATDLCDAVRSIILEKVITAETLIHDAGVEHRNFCPRNIMIFGSEYDSPEIPAGNIQVEVRVIDFNIAAVIMRIVRS
jgi:hypothetical protein